MERDDLLRQLFVGHDPRRISVHPTDRARAEALVAQYGGVIEMRNRGPGRMLFQWLDERGQSVLVEGDSPAECLTMIQAAITADEIDFTY